MVDVFEEVEGELRADRYRSLARRSAPWLIAAAAAALVAVLAVWGFGEWRRRQAAAASETYAQALVASQQDRPRAERLFGEVAAGDSPVYRTLALQQLAGLKVAADRPREAVPLLDQAAEAAPDDILADAARLKAALLAMDYAPFAETERRLRPLVEEGRPFRSAAREALAMAQIAAGRPQEARLAFLAISQDLDAPPPAQARAQAMLAALESGAAAQVPAILKATPIAAAPQAADPQAEASTAAPAVPQVPAASGPAP